MSMKPIQPPSDRRNSLCQRRLDLNIPQPLSSSGRGHLRSGEFEVFLEYEDFRSLEGTQRLDESSLANVMRQILSGLDYIHQRYIVHGDIKPSSLFINSLNQVKIADYRVSEILKCRMDHCHPLVQPIAYMSPKRINMEPKGGRYNEFAADIWSVGVCILELYKGHFPYVIGRDSDLASLKRAICRSRPPEAPTSASDEFQDFMRCCLHIDTMKRWTASQLLQHPFINRKIEYGGSVRMY